MYARAAHIFTFIALTKPSKCKALINNQIYYLLTALTSAAGALTVRILTVPVTHPSIGSYLPF